MSAQQKTPGKATVRPMEAGDINSGFEIRRSLIREEGVVLDTNLIATDPDGTLGLSFVTDEGGEMVGFIGARNAYIEEPPAEGGLIQWEEK